MSPADYAGGGGYSGRRALSQSRIVHQDFPQFHSSSHRVPSNAPIAAAPVPPIHQSSQISLNPPPPYSSASLGHNFRTRSLDHRRFPAAFSSGEYSSGAGGGAASGRAFYTSFGGGGGGIGGASRKAYGQKYTGELFGGGTGAEVAKSVSSSGGGHYRSSSAEKSGVTVVPIRRDMMSTLPSRRMQSEWKSSSSGFAGGGGGYAAGGPSLIQQQIAAQQQREEEEVEGPKEEYQFERSSKFNQQRQAFQRPMQNFYDRWHRMEMIEGPRSGGAYFPSDTTADYSTFRRSHQAGSDAAAAAAAAESAAQHQKNEQHTRTQQHQREYREYHSGRHQRAAAATAGAADYGTLGTRRSATERHAARGVGTGNGGGGHHQQQQQYYYREGAYAGGGGGAGGRDLRYQNYRPEHQQQQHYANGWTGGGGQQHQQYHQHHMRRSASAGGGGGGFFGTGRKSKSSKSSGARWSATQKTDHPQGPKRYRKIRVCCFNMIWPPWAVEPSGPPRPIYGRSKASGSPTPIPVEHRPPPFYAAGEGPPPGSHPQSAFVGPPPQHPENVAPTSRAIPNDVAGGYGPPEYRGPPPAAHGGGGGIHGPPPPNQQGRDVPDYRVPMHVPSDYQGYRGPVGGVPPLAPTSAAAAGGGVGMQSPQKHDYRHPREIPVQYQQPLPQSSRRE